jgi:imidazolonepropionase-like amidohydrolase
MANPLLKFDPPIDVESVTTPWKQRRPKTYIFTNASVIDPLDGSIRSSATVSLVGGLVHSVADENIPTPHRDDDNTLCLDLKGKYILPGLWDCHVHLAAVQGSRTLDEILHLSPETNLLRQPSIGQEMLDRGFTTVRDCGGAGLALKRAFAEGIHPGPHLFIAGHQLSQSGGCGDGRSPLDDKDSQCCGGAKQLACRIVDGVPECLRFSREELRHGADFLKIMAGGGVASPRGGLGDAEFTEEELRAITTVAENAGTFVTAHAYTPGVIRRAVECGVMGIEHGNFLDRETAELMATKGVFLTPTLVTYAVSEMAEFGSFVSDESKTKLKDTLESGLEAIELAKQAGVTICFGTDLLGPMHFAQTKEFQLRSAVQSPLEIVQSATVNAARMMRREESFGRVAPGFVADFMILNANPLEDITVLDRPERHLLAVFKEGRVVSSRWSLLETRSRRLEKIM